MRFHAFAIECVIALAFVLSEMADGQTMCFWQIAGDNSIEWFPDSATSHFDHVEMSGREISAVLRYGVNTDGSFSIEKSLVWPLLRTIPNNTHASLMRRYKLNPLDALTINGRSLINEKVKRVRLKGYLSVESDYDNGRYGKWKLKRTFFPSTDKPLFVETYRLTNTGDRKLDVEIPAINNVNRTDPAKGVDGSYIIETTTIAPASHLSLNKGESVEFSAVTSARRESDNPIFVDSRDEFAKRGTLIDSWINNLKLETPDTVINQMHAFSKIRACESIYATKGGPMHGPGGESYYAAIWANDQAEYINPYFPFTGYTYGNESALNSFRHFARFINPDYKPIPSSIIAEGIDIWDGAGDRGDAAMIAYGAARYVLARGSVEEARELWPLIEWCLEYCERKLTAEGVVASDSDELEGRFPSGDANLCTSSLYYDALLSASFLSDELDYRRGREYREKAERLRKNINRHFGAMVEGYDTYAYYTGNDKLRSWICIPLTMGIDEKAEGTLDALYSPRLWTDNGLLSQSGDKTFWDRSTLYALRGAYAAGDTERATDYLKFYSRRRLLGDHVPYPIEAWPEGSQRHLSAESGLFGRIITEGMFGIRPVGLRSFTMTPRLPEEWSQSALRKINAFGNCFDIELKRMDNGKIEVRILPEGARKQIYVITPGDKLKIKL